MKYLILIAMFGGLVWWMGYTSDLQTERMKAQYCWDSNGDHYVAPDERCRFGNNY